jgi:hypothetical protein
MNVREVIALLNPYASWKAERRMTGASARVPVDLLPNGVVRKEYLDAGTSGEAREAFEAEIAALQALRGCRYVSRLLHADRAGWAIYTSYCGDPLAAKDWTHRVQTVALRYHKEISNKYLLEHIVNGRLFVANVGAGQWRKLPPPPLPQDHPIQDDDADREWDAFLARLREAKADTPLETALPGLLAAKPAGVGAPLPKLLPAAAQLPARLLRSLDRGGQEGAALKPPPEETRHGARPGASGRASAGGASLAPPLALPWSSSQGPGGPVPPK